MMLNRRLSEKQGGENSEEGRRRPGSLKRAATQHSFHRPATIKEAVVEMPCQYISMRRPSDPAYSYPVPRRPSDTRRSSDHRRPSDPAYCHPLDRQEHAPGNSRMRKNSSLRRGSADTVQPIMEIPQMMWAECLAAELKSPTKPDAPMKFPRARKLSRQTSLLSFESIAEVDEAMENEDDENQENESLAPMEKLNRSLSIRRKKLKKTGSRGSGSSLKIPKQDSQSSLKSASSDHEDRPPTVAETGYNGPYGFGDRDCFLYDQYRREQLKGKLTKGKVDATIEELLGAGAYTSLKSLSHVTGFKSLSTGVSCVFYCCPGTRETCDLIIC